MSLKDLDLELSYESDTQDLANRFYSPALSEAERYDRITAFFGSSSFVIAGSGLEELIKKNGKVRLIFDYLTSERDKEVLEGDFQQEIAEEVENLEDDIVEDHVALLAWLLENDKLEIKIARAKGTFHPKIGLLTDKKGNQISFSGSNNETLSGWKDNIEEFKVFRSWVKGQSGYFQSDKNTFQRYWWGKTQKAEIYELQEAVKQNILRYKPESEEELQERLESIIEWRKGQDDIETAEPRDYQDEAISRWESNDFRGIWKMATGTGKTWTSIWGIERLEEVESDPLITVIVVPYSHLADQWFEELEKFGYDAISTLDYGKWEDEFEDMTMNISLGAEDRVILLTTYQKYIQDSFKQKLRDSPGKKLIVADEVHKAGATEHRKGLSEIYDYRLGLSATPERYMDEKGTEEILEYFEGIVKEYGLEKAIEEDHLTDYKYHVDIIELTESEREEYLEYTKKIASMLSSDDLDEEQEEVLENLTRRRADILKSASQKMEVFENKIEEFSDLSRTLVYCNDSNQVTRAMNVLDSHHIKSHRFTQHEDDEKRKKLAKCLEDGRIDALVAMQCLDEGFNVPAIEKAILVSSTRNPAQYIQRRGRVLRDAEGKDYAKIYDFLVVPKRGPGYEPSEAEKKVAKKEMERIQEFASLAKNSEEAIQDLKKILDRYM